MSRWDSLKCEKEGEKERHERHEQHNGSMSRNKQWTASSNNNKSGGTQHRNYATSLQGRQQQQQQQQQRFGGPVFPSVSRTETIKNGNKPPMSIAERDALVNSLKLHLFQYQSGSKDYEKSVVIQSLRKLCYDTTSVSRAETRNEQSCNPDMFMTLLNLLEIEEDENDDDGNGDDNVHLVVTRSIERCLRNSINDEKNSIDLTKSQVIFGINALSSHYNKSSVRSSNLQSNNVVDSSLLMSLALLVKNNIDESPSELTAQRVLGAIFIPYLSSLKQGQNEQKEQEQKDKLSTKTTTASSIAKVICICEALIAFLQNPSHASAMLAPLVQDVFIVSDYGMEEQTVNPLRMQLLWALLQHLETSGNNERRIEEQVYVCRTLSAVIDAIRKLKKGNENKNAYNEDVQILKPLQNFIVQVLIENNMDTAVSEELMVASLQLLRSLIASYPNGMTGMGWKLMIEGANYPPTLSNASSYDMSSSVTSYLPSMIMTDNNDIRLRRNDVNSEAIALAMNCLTDLILVLPWNIWLKQSASNQGRQRYDATRSHIMTPIKANTSGLYKTVMNALVALIVIAKHAFENCRDKTLMNSLGRLLKALLLEIPYYDIKLIGAGGDLWETIIKVASNSLVPGTYNKEKENLSFEVLLASAGGTVTPQGELRGMSIPARTWFLNRKSYTESFIKLLMASFGSMDERLECSAKILSSVLRTLPDVALQRWYAFHKLFEELNTGSTSKKDLLRLEVLESFMLGRKDFDVSTDLKHENDRIIIDLDDIMLRRWSRNGLRRCVTIYSAFRSQDWIQLDRIDGRVLCHFDKISEHCHDSNAKIREGASKAVGEFCTQYIVRNSSPGGILEEIKVQQYPLIADKVRMTMLELCMDQNAAVRSMSIFSLGNLASALQESNYKDLLDTSRLHEISKAILETFNDTNGKVVKNAIRSVGHTGNLLAWSLLRDDKNESFSSSCELLVGIIESLTQKLSNTLHVALNEEQKAAMTWKERSAAKKHGWGACHSLGLVFEGLSVGIFEECNGLVSACFEAIRYLVLCPYHYSILNEKVVLAAMAAIGHLPAQLLTLIDSEKGNIGDALTISILILEYSQNIRTDIGSSNKSYYNNRTATVITSKLATQNQHFLRHLLGSASITDANKALNDDRITTQQQQQTLGILYAWMVEPPQLDTLPARAFDIFAVALQQPGRWSANVALEQQFTSRALQKYKQATQNGQNSLSLKNSGSSPQQDVKDDDEADEL